MLKRLSFALAVLFCIFHCWTAMFGAAAGIGQKAIHLGLVLIIFFLDYLAQEDRKWYCRVMDAFFILASAGSLIYIMSIDKTIDLRSGMIYTYDILFGVLLIITLIEATRRAVDIVKGTDASIADTRKTLPGLRAMQKYAVTVGGGRNHRFNLSDGAMLKDNHIDAAGGIPAAVSMIREKLGHMVKLEVETRNLEEVEQALKAGADVIMLDNMDCPAMKQAAELCRAAGRANGGHRPLLEASGGITDETLRAVAETGVDIISIGALTHSVKALDISMKIAK